MLLNAETSQVLIVDVQDRLLPAMRQPDAVVRGCSILLEAAETLEIPVTLSEQYPAGLGPTVEPLRSRVSQDVIYEKLHFSCMSDDTIRARLQVTGRDTVVLGGIESHVCVQQTALELAQAGMRPVVVADAVSSRKDGSIRLAMDRMASHGVEIVTAEMVIFEWLRVAGTDAFKSLSRLIK